MSGFSAEWLALRAAADRRSRSRPLLAVLRRRLAGRAGARSPLRILDLGAGTGSTLAALAPVLPGRQQWTLADDDAALLWRAVAAPRPFRVLVRTIAVNLADPAALPALIDGTRLATASALLDLVSLDWCRRLVRLLAGFELLALELARRSLAMLALHREGSEENAAESTAQGHFEGTEKW